MRAGENPTLDLRVRFTVEAESAGSRLDKLVGARLGLGRRRTAELFQQGAVRTGARPAKKGDLGQAGDIIDVAPGAPDHAVAEPEIPLAVRHVTAQVLVVSKPAGQPTAPLRGGERGTLAGALLGRYPELAGFGHSALEPGLVHRLDTGTSGLVLVGRTRPAAERLSAALSAGAIEKRYLAIVGAAALTSESGQVDLPLAPHPGDPRRVAWATSGGLRGARAASTRFHVRARHGTWALLEVEAPRAYRHQVRAHLASLGLPLAGDALYGGPPAPELGTRHALHASYVAWTGDAEIAGFAVRDDLPRDMSVLLDG